MTEAPPAAEPRPSRWRASRVALAVAVVLMVAMWGYVIYLAVGPGRQPPPDRLDDPAFADAAQQVCRAALVDVSALPPAVSASAAAARAEIVTEANERFAQMLDELAAQRPDGEEGEVVDAWLADWHTYLDDRVAYAEALREDPGARLLVTPRDREQVTEFIDAFAKDNGIPACATPLDVS